MTAHITIREAIAPIEANIIELEKLRAEGYWNSFRVVSGDLAEKGVSVQTAVAGMHLHDFGLLLKAWSAVRRQQYPGSPDYTFAEIQQLTTGGMAAKRARTET